MAYELDRAIEAYERAIKYTRENAQERAPNTDDTIMLAALVISDGLALVARALLELGRRIDEIPGA